MRKPLFLIVCLFLLLFAVTAPALAQPFYVVNPYDGSVVVADRSQHAASPVDSIPAGSTVVCGYSWIAVNRGLAATAPYAFRMRLRVVDASGTLIARCGKFDCQSSWGGLYRWNVMWCNSPDMIATAYNPKMAAGIWARDWLVPCGTLPVGEYTVTYNEMLTRAVADPMWAEPGSVPAVWPAYGWSDAPIVSTFEVTED